MVSGGCSHVISDVYRQNMDMANVNLNSPNIKESEGTTFWKSDTHIDYFFGSLTPIWTTCWNSDTDMDDVLEYNTHIDYFLEL